MRHLIFSILIVLGFFSCSSSRPVSETHDPGNSSQRMKLTCQIRAYSLEMNDAKVQPKQGKIKTVHRFEVSDPGKAKLRVEFQTSKLIPKTKSDSVLVLIVDDEILQIHKLSDLTYVIPENLWASVANCSKMEYRIGKGKDQLEIRPDKSQMKDLNAFFERAVFKRDANQPPLPEGMKKW